MESEQKNTSLRPPQEAHSFCDRGDGASPSCAQGLVGSVMLWRGDSRTGAWVASAAGGFVQKYSWLWVNGPDPDAISARGFAATVNIDHNIHSVGIVVGTESVGREWMTVTAVFPSRGHGPVVKECSNDYWHKHWEFVPPGG